jgi:hypothetical protein
MFVSQASIDQGVIESYNLRKRVEPVKNCRNIGKKDMKYNDAMPKMKVDPESYVSWSFSCISHRKSTLTIVMIIKIDCRSRWQALYCGTGVDAPAYTGILRLLS